MKQKLVLPFILGLLLSACGVNENQSIFFSPDGNLAVQLSVNDDTRQLYYEVQYKRQHVIEKSAFGVIKDGLNIGEQVTLGKAEMSEKTDSFPMWGNHSGACETYNEIVVPINSKNDSYKLVIRAYDHAIALRSQLNNSDSCTVNGEALAWKLPENTKVWFQQEWFGYEGQYTTAGMDTLKADMNVALPVTAKLSNGLYAVLTEADVVNYSDLALRIASDRSLKAAFNADTLGWKGLPEMVQPWRVVLVANDLNELVNNDVIYSLASPAEIDVKKEAWIKPGRSTWQWWSSGDPLFEEQDQWIDWTAQLGFEYYLIDDGWKKWRKGDQDEWACLKEVVDKAKAKNIGAWLWVNSNEVDTPQKRMDYFNKVKAAGVVGIKIDFMPAASFDWINWYDETSRDAAAVKLMVDYHGAVKPSGRNRTWPNEMTREAIRGHEWHILRYNRTLSASHDCILPFNRYVQGFADYTPTVLNPAELRGFTWAREIAQAVIFTSPFLCYADRPDFYLKSEAVNLIKEIPSVWDETIVLPGSEIGECAAFARRNGNRWFVAVMNGEKETALTLQFDFLKKDSPYKLTSFQDKEGKDDAFVQRVSTIDGNEKITLNLRPGGGYVAICEAVQ